VELLGLQLSALARLPRLVEILHGRRLNRLPLPR
jgi:hypothetical protein